MAIKMTYLVWDHKEQLEPDEINSALSEVFDGKHCPWVAAIEDGSDAFGVVFCSQQPRDVSAPQAFFDAEMERMNEEPKA